MITGPSPLLHPAAIDFPLPNFVPAAVAAELEAWLREHDMGGAFDQLDRVAIDERHLYTHFRGDRALVGPWTTSLRSHPSIGMLAGLVSAGVLVCASPTPPPDNPGPYRCNVLVDDQGRHPGRHTDGRYGDCASWPNDNPTEPPTAPLPAVAPVTRRRGVYVLGDETIARALRLPPGQRIMGIGTDFVRLAVLIKAEGDGLPAVAEGHEAPTVGGDWWAGMTAPGPAALAQLPALERHTAVLAAVEATVLEDTAALQGRLAILRRHAPNPTWAAWDGCRNCVTGTGGDPEGWPCPDYLDAAGGLLQQPDPTGATR